MTWGDIWRRLVLLWRAERNWRKGMRLSVCQKCGDMLLEDASRPLCASCIAASGPRPIPDTVQKDHELLAAQLAFQPGAAIAAEGPPQFIILPPVSNPS